MQSVSRVFQVLLQSVASSAFTLGSSNNSQLANSTLTDASLISTTLTSAVSDTIGAASNGSVGNTAGAAVSGVADTVSAIASAFGRRLLRDGGSTSSLAGRQLMQSTVMLPLHTCALLQVCLHMCLLSLCLVDLAYLTPPSL